MKRMISSALAVTVAAATAVAAPGVLRQSGDCKLQVGDAFDDEKVVQVKLADAQVEAQ